MALFLSVEYRSEGFVVLRGESETAYLDGTKGHPESEFTPRKQSGGIDITKDCPACRGTGESPFNGIYDRGDRPCRTCDGSGKVLVCGKCGKIRLHGETCTNKCLDMKKRAKEVAKDILRTCQQKGWKVCPTCQGFGETSISGSVCPTCDGAGRLKDEQKKEKS